MDDAIRRLVDDMFETMYAAPGVGLAATQVDVHKCLLVADVSEDRSQPLCFINPELVVTQGVQLLEEGCLSVPGIFERVERAERVTVRALDRNGQSFELAVEGLLAVCVQHEMDHLEGRLFVDYLSELKRQRIRKRLTKARRPEAAETPAGRATPAL